jgi:CubicO group peptidase (beta-lactamase class C family)
MTADIPRVLGSGSKWVASTALLAMIQAANASVDDKMTKYLSWWKEDNRTLKHFLQMTSGMVADGTDSRIDGGPPDNDERKTLNKQQNLAFFGCNLGPKNVSHSECMRKVYERTTPLYPPGKYFMYGTLTFNFVAAAMEVALGKPIDVLLKEYLLDPLKMAGPWTNMINQDEAAIVPSLGGGLVATNREYAGFLQAMLKKSFLPVHLHDTQEAIELKFEQYSTQNQVFGPYGMGIWGECIQGSYFSGWPESCQNNQRITHPGCFGYWDWISRRDGYFFSMMPSYTCDESNGWCGRGVKPDDPESCPELTFSQMYRDAVIGNIDDLFVKK